MTTRSATLALVVAVLAAAGGASATDAGLPRPVPRVLFVAIAGQGRVTSSPHGISCPRACRAFFPKDSRVRLVARPAAGWKLARWGGAFCSGSRAGACAFNLTTSHDCSAALCKVGSFGLRVTFVTASRP